MINIGIGNNCRKMKKFDVMIWTICMPQRDRVGSRVNDRMSVMRIEDKMSQMYTHGVQGQRLELSTRLKDTLSGTWRMREGMMGTCILIPGGRSRGTKRRLLRQGRRTCGMGRKKW